MGKRAYFFYSLDMNPLLRSLSVGLLVVLPVSAAVDTAPAEVHTAKIASGWSLLVNSRPYYVKGIACNDMTGDQGEDFLKMAAEAGANTVRIYGDVTPEYLERAQKYGLMVNVGFWFNAIRLQSKESYRDAAHCQMLHDQALAYVRKFKTYPAVLTWTMGNEVFSFSDAPEEKAAFGAFLETLVKDIHKEDPNHPVLYASSYSRCLKDLKKYAPDIDIVGVNVTGGAGSAIHWVEQNDFDKPVLVTEFAPFGSWEQRKDVNGGAYDPFDQFKADNYQSSWRQIQANPKTCIGGFAFMLGAFRNQDSLTWYNMNYGNLKRAGYWMIRELYTGQKPSFPIVKITSLEVTPMANVTPGSRIHMKATTGDAASATLHYDYFITNIASDPLIVEKPTFYPPDVKSSTAGVATIKAPTAPGVYRVYAMVTDGHGNVAIADRTIKVKSKN
jgi:hypothetical protein